MKISVIIPTYNEEENIRELITYLLGGKEKTIEVIVVDGRSSDGTAHEAKEAGAKVISCAVRGRSSQMNQGASVATGDAFYFLHADSYPPQSFASDIFKAVQQGYGSGCYRLAFDHHHWFLKFNCWFTRFNIDWIRFGDQSLFVTRSVFEKVDGYDEQLRLMEDQEVVPRIKQQTKFIVFNKAVITSARKYMRNGIYRLQGIFTMIYMLHFLGFSQARLVKMYNRWVN